MSSRKASFLNSHHKADQLKYNQRGLVFKSFSCFFLEAMISEWLQDTASVIQRCCVPNPLTAEWALRALRDFTLSNARRFYSSMGNPLDGKGLMDLTNGNIFVANKQKMEIQNKFVIFGERHILSWH